MQLNQREKNLFISKLFNGSTINQYLLVTLLIVHIVCLTSIRSTAEIPVNIMINQTSEIFFNFFFAGLCSLFFGVMMEGSGSEGQVQYQPGTHHAIGSLG